MNRIILTGLISILLLGDTNCQSNSLVTLLDSISEMRVSHNKFIQFVDSIGSKICVEEVYDSVQRRRLLLMFVDNRNNRIIPMDVRLGFFYKNYYCFTEGEKTRIKIYLNSNISYKDLHFFSLVAMYKLNFNWFLEAQVSEEMFQKARKDFASDSFLYRSEFDLYCAATLASTNNLYYRFNDSIISMVLDMYFDSGAYNNEEKLTSFYGVPIRVLSYLNTRSSVVETLTILDSCAVNADEMDYLITMYYNMIILPKLDADFKILDAIVRRESVGEKLLAIRNSIWDSVGIRWKSFIVE